MFTTHSEFVRHLDCCNPFCDRYSPARVPQEQAGENDPAGRARYLPSLPPSSQHL